MALHPEFPTSLYAPLVPEHRWFPADETLRGHASALIDIRSASGQAHTCRICV